MRSEICELRQNFRHKKQEKDKQSDELSKQSEELETSIQYYRLQKSRAAEIDIQIIQ
jgi:hypothetical protein